MDLILDLSLHLFAVRSTYRLFLFFCACIFTCIFFPEDFFPLCLICRICLGRLCRNLIPLLVICLVTTPLVFLVTGWTVQAVMKWTARKEDKTDV